ncbi:DUF1295 domain-containing protein [Streptomyces longispororuber]|uniref:DUF1295 domain-containing protein n=1 Tax=Streptomyces longispororuber TaxID=68230 RepID=UPI00210C696E|nr:DUF1295 domain-containing protein [Streptomyces longispororuber]MCQ4210652.1 DUF1295 domain-containing protein [Streptomyces longispororuber]
MNGFPWAALALNAAVSAGAVLVVVLAAFAVGVRTGRHRGVDVAWGIGFAAVAGATYGMSAGHGDAARRVLVLVLTAVWGLRLALHIAWRSRGHGEDPRYERMLAKAPGRRDLYALRMVYLLQGALILLVSLPVQIASYAPSEPSLLAVIGTVVWGVGLCFEAVGDHQLARFRADPAHRGQIMDRGLWSWTRHPNYFGDFCVWWGLFLVACEAGPWPALLAALSPLTMSFLLLNGSGKPLLERHMADRPGYAAYAARTSGFFPRPPRRDRPPR